MRVADPAEVTEQIKTNRAAIEALMPAIERREVIFNWTAPDGTPVEKIYIQAELGMFPVQEFMTIVTEILDSFVEGEMGMKIGELFRGDVSMPVTFDADTVNSAIEDNLQLIKAFVKLVKIVPGFQLQILCLSLGVPRREWPWAMEQMKEPPHRGGLTVIEGADLLIWFIKQNAILIKETVTGKARELVEVFQLEVLGQEKVEETETMAPEKEPPSLGGMLSSTSSPDTTASD